jgi:hypothetical protein
MAMRAARANFADISDSFVHRTGSPRNKLIPTSQNQTAGWRTPLARLHLQIVVPGENGWHATGMDENNGFAVSAD